MAKKSFIPPSVFLVILGIVVLTSFAVRLLLPDEEASLSLPKAEDYQALLNNLNAADIFGNVNVNSAVQESESVLLSVSVADRPLYFVSETEDAGIDNFETTLASKDTIWGTMADNTVFATPYAFGLNGVIYPKSLTDENGTVIASALQEFDVRSKTTRELTRIDHATYTEEGYADRIDAVSYDAESKSVAFLVNRAVGSDKAHPIIDQTAQEVYLYLSRSDGREPSTVEQIDVADQVGTGWIEGIEYTLGTVFLLVRDAAGPDPSVMILYSGGTFSRVVLPEPGRLVPSSSSSSAFVQGANRDALYEVKPLSAEVIAHTDLTPNDQWKFTPLMSDDGTSVYIAKEKSDGSGVDGIERVVLADRTREDVVSGAYLPRAVLARDHLLIENAGSESGRFSVYDLEDDIRTPVNELGTIRFFGPR
ncbi:MAG: hypothetical protein HYV34_00080 [Candidatus Kerfeldbacteria bacterium]|nr:hypothetical protein [Candidatus Kerfeldbacteria bacterium]